MQQVFFEKVYAVYKAPETGEFSRIFVVKVTLQSVKLFLTVGYRKKIGGAGCITCSLNNFVGGATAPPVPAPVCTGQLQKSTHENMKSFTS